MLRGASVLSQDSGLALLRLLQLASPALPVGAYSYSEGLETLAHQGVLPDQTALVAWLTQELQLGCVRVDAAVMVRAYQTAIAQDWPRLLRWNQWLTAARESEELRSQSLQMGRSLLKLYQSLQPEVVLPVELMQSGDSRGTHFAIAFGLVAAAWQVPLESALLGYLQSWASNLISAGIKLIPLGQTAGQRVLFELQPQLQTAAHGILELADDDLVSCSWGLSLASMAHEGLYSRLFRS